MSGQYSFSRKETPPQPQPSGVVLAIDTGSPVVSVALSAEGDVVAERAIELRRSSGRLLGMIDEVLADAGLRLTDVDLLVGLRGPGSFTGLRVGLATLQGIQMALGTATGTLPTLQVLATLAPAEVDTVTACVDALQGRWITQDFCPDPQFRPLAEPRLRSGDAMFSGESRCWIGFGISSFRPLPEEVEGPIRIEPGPLAPQALRALEICPPDLSAAHLTSPLYLQPPAATPQIPSPE